jgi:hypothetical protein
MEERSRLERTLASAHDDDLLACEASEVRVFGGVRDEFIREIAELARLPGEGSDTACDDNAAGRDGLTFAGVQEKARRRLVNGGDGSPVDIVRAALLYPSAVG